MLAYPYQTDQFFWSRRAAAIGVAPPCRYRIQKMAAGNLAEGLRFLAADAVRARLEAVGVGLLDAPGGTTWRPVGWEEEPATEGSLRAESTNTNAPETATVSFCSGRSSKIRLILSAP
jgi:hypothetical protein